MFYSSQKTELPDFQWVDLQDKYDSHPGTLYLCPPLTKGGLGGFGKYGHLETVITSLRSRKLP
jgi:hypothetical protein